VRDSDKHAIDSACLLAIVAVMVGAWIVKALKHPNVKRMAQAFHHFQGVDLQHGLQPLGREEVVGDKKGQIDLERRAVGVLKCAPIAAEAYATARPIAFLLLLLV